MPVTGATGRFLPASIEEVQGIGTQQAYKPTSADGPMLTYPTLFVTRLGFSFLPAASRQRGQWQASPKVDSPDDTSLLTVVIGSYAENLLVKFM